MATEQLDKHPETEIYLRNPLESGLTDGKTLPADDGAPTQSKLIARRNTSMMTDKPPEGVSQDVMTILKGWKKFCVLAVQIDPPASKKDPQPLHEPILTLLHETQKQHQALRFHWNGPLYCCILPDNETDKALITAKNMQARLAQTHIETITIGIAAFPLISFNRSQTLVNACKALDHAAFFGPASTAVFDAVSLNISGDQHYQTGDLGAAIAEYRAALRLDPKNINVNNSLGVCMAKIEDIAAAREAFQAVLAIDPMEPMALHNMGLICLHKDEPRQALEWFEKAYALDHKTFEIPYQIGKLLTQQQDWLKAKDCLEKALEMNRKSGPTLCLIGECLTGLTRIPDAISAYKKAVKLNPNDASALSALGVLYKMKSENPEICMTFCRQSVHLAPQNGLYRKRLAMLHHHYDELDQALAEYEKAAALGQDCCLQIEQVRLRMAAETEKKICCA